MIAVTHDPPVYRAPVEWAKDPAWPMTDPDASVSLSFDAERTVPKFRIPASFFSESRGRHSSG